MNDYLTLPHVGCLSYISLTFALGLLTSWDTVHPGRRARPLWQDTCLLCPEIESLCPSIHCADINACCCCWWLYSAAACRPMSSWHQHWSSGRWPATADWPQDGFRVHLTRLCFWPQIEKSYLCTSCYPGRERAAWTNGWVRPEEGVPRMLIMLL